MTEHFVSIFKKSGVPEARGKYLSRIFGIFSEEIVRIWANDPRSPYEDIGRPTIRMVGSESWSTLDFTFRNRNTGKIYVAELKCEVEYQNYRYLVLTDVKQLDHHKKSAFTALLNAAQMHKELRVYVEKREVQIDGAMLIWGAVTSAGRDAVMVSKQFSEVLSLAEMISDLRSWNSQPYLMLLKERQSWSNELFASLA